MRVGLALLPEAHPAQDDRWSRAEQLGFAHAWCFDHLAWRSLADSTWHATVPVLAAAALSTSTIALGTFVASPNYRHPVPFAKELMTLDVMSHGRLLVGIGAGAPGFDATVLGGAPLSPQDRQSRFEEFVTLLDLSLRQSRTSWDGAYFRALDARTIPGPVQRPRPPFVIAGNGPRGMRLALAHGDGWATMGTAPHGSDPEAWWKGVAEAANRFDELAVNVDVPPTGMRRYLDHMALAGPVGSVEQLHDDAGRAAALGFTDVVMPWPRAGDPFAGSVDVIERLADRLVDGGLAT
ncbi:MAG TPA: LLM class flavin-dependent oxidoreductase [Jatrophihabitans sp.]|jgi:alkanesulfonate monooxygenase SsuD/methylene tetrahydromethanopterin reductase-like flavin-dependent oxidoreductase (luciferase family)